MVQPVHVQHVQQVQPVQPIQHVQHVQQQPVQYVVKESQYRPPPQPQFVQTRSTGGDVNYVAAAPGRPVSTLRDSKLFFGATIIAPITHHLSYMSQPKFRNKQTTRS